LPFTRLLFNDAGAGVRGGLPRVARRPIVAQLQFLISQFVRHRLDSQCSRQISSIHSR
jgi:hypothetical protein